MAHEDQDFFDTEALKEAIGAKLSQESADIFPSNFRRFLKPIIPDPNQLSIPSEPVVRGTFADRLPHPTQTGEAFRVEQSAKAKGNKIVLNSILEQIESLPSLRGEDDDFAFPGLDIFFADVFQQRGSLTDPQDQAIQKIRRETKETIEGGVGT